jgi:hypothetical protein
MTIKITAFVIISILSLLVSNTVFSAQTTAAVTTSVMTKAYENSQYGFRILYPVNWYIAPKNTLHSMEFLYYGTDTVIAFVAPIGTFLDVLASSIINFRSVNSVDTAVRLISPGGSSKMNEDAVWN